MFIVLIGLLIRFIVAYLFVSVRNHDTVGWEMIGSWTIQGKGIYPFPAHEYHAFFPLFLYIDALGIFFQRMGIPYMFVIKTICSSFDAGIIYLVYLLSNRDKQKAWIYALNPITIMINSVHGQFEAIPVFFLLLSVYLLNKKRIFISGFIASIAIGFKTWPVIFIWPLIKHARKLWFPLLLIIIPTMAIGVYMVVFNNPLWPIIHETLFYRGQIAPWGIGYFISLVTEERGFMKIISNLFLITFFVFVLHNKRPRVTEEILNLMIYFFIFTPTFGLQWLAWLVPFIIIQMPKYSYVFLITASLYVFIPNYFWFSQKEDVMKLNAPLGVLSWGSLLIVGWERLLVVARLDGVNYRNNHQKKN